jgi:hypothetical protein
MSVLSRGRGRPFCRVTAVLAAISVLLVALSAVATRPSAAKPQAAQAVPTDQAATSAVALAADPSGFDHAFYRRVLSISNGLGYVAVRWTVDSLGWQGRQVG